MLKHLLLPAGLVLFFVPTGSSKSQSPAKNLVQNPGFESPGPNDNMPARWRTVTPREELSPAFSLDPSVSHSGKFSARSTARGNPGTLGYWAATVDGIGPEGQPEAADMSLPTVGGAGFLGGRYYRVGCYFKASDVESISRSVWIRVDWLDGKGREIFTEFVSDLAREDGWYRAEQVLAAPRAARSLNIGLVLQWTPDGTVWWDDVTVEEVSPPAPRKIKVATVTGQPPPGSTPDSNRSHFAQKVDEAGRLGVDLLCLGEGITVVSTGRKYVDVAEPVPGPTSTILGEAARRARLYVVAGIYEREGPLVYNTALLIDRNGEVAGKYRKTHLPETEVYGGLTPGTSYPVFRTDFGTVGIEICYDNFFPEVARSLALQGAEIILLPIWGDGRGENYAWDIVARARAIDNSVYLVASIYSGRRSLIVDPGGHILADTGGRDGMVTAEIDLNGRTFDRWLSVGSYGEWKSLFPKERRAETYRNLLTSPERK